MQEHADPEAPLSNVELEARLIRQDFRPLQILLDLLRVRSLPPGDPRRAAALKALVFNVLFAGAVLTVPTATVAVSVYTAWIANEQLRLTADPLLEIEPTEWHAPVDRGVYSVPVINYSGSSASDVRLYHDVVVVQQSKGQEPQAWIAGVLHAKPNAQFGRIGGGERVSSKVDVRKQLQRIDAMVETAPEVRVWKTLRIRSHWRRASDGRPFVSTRAFIIGQDGTLFGRSERGLDLGMPGYWPIQKVLSLAESDTGDWPNAAAVSWDGHSWNLRPADERAED